MQEGQNLNSHYLTFEKGIYVFAISLLFLMYLYRQMHPLLGKALLRLGLLEVYTLIFAWVFTLIERKDGTAEERMERMLTELRTDVGNKYNMTDDDFESFIRRATAAVSAGDELDWTFLSSGQFVFAALTTIGKPSESIINRRWRGGGGRGNQQGIAINTYKLPDAFSPSCILTVVCYVN